MPRVRFLLLVAFVLMCSCAAAQSSVKTDLRRHMLENGVSMFDAMRHYGLSFDEVATAYGYEGFGGFIRATREAILVFAECVNVYVYTQGTAETIELTRMSLASYANLRHANDLSFLPRCETNSPQRNVDLSLTIWTVGSDYPVAYHISAETLLFTYGLNNVQSNNPFEAAYLGYADVARVRGVVDEVISEIMRDFALTLLHVRH